MTDFSSLTNVSTRPFTSPAIPSAFFLTSPAKSPIFCLASFPETGAKRRASPAPMSPPARNATKSPPAPYPLSSLMTVLLSEQPVHHGRQGGLDARHSARHISKDRHDREIQDRRGRIECLAESANSLRHVLDVVRRPLGATEDLQRDGARLADLLGDQFEMAERFVEADRDPIGCFPQFPKGYDDRDDQHHRRRRGNRKKDHLAAHPVTLLSSSDPPDCRAVSAPPQIKYIRVRNIRNRRRVTIRREPGTG